MAGDAELRLERGVGSHVGDDGGIGNIFDETCAEHGSGNAEDEVADLVHLLEIRLGHDAALGVLAAGDGEKVMHTAIGSAGDATAGGNHEGEAGSAGASPPEGRLPVATAATIEIEARTEADPRFARHLAADGVNLQ